MSKIRILSLDGGGPARKAWFGIEPEVTAELRAMVERTI